MFDHDEQYKPVARFSLLAHKDILAAANTIVKSGQPLSARALCGRCEHAGRRPGRTVRSWLLMMYLADLLERVRWKGTWYYWPAERLKDLLHAGGVSAATFLPPIRPLMPNPSMFQADGPETLEPGYVDPNTDGARLPSRSRPSPSPCPHKEHEANDKDHWYKTLEELDGDPWRFIVNRDTGKRVSLRRFITRAAAQEEADRRNEKM